MTDIIDLIDEVTALTCAQCTSPLPTDGPSAEFCGEDCQEGWHARRAEPAAAPIDQLVHRLTPTERAHIASTGAHLRLTDDGTWATRDWNHRLANPTGGHPTIAMFVGGRLHGETIPVSGAPSSTMYTVEPVTPDDFLFGSDDLRAQLVTYYLKSHNNTHWLYVDFRPVAPQRTINVSGQPPLTVDYHHHNFPCDRWWVTIASARGGVVCELPSELLVNDEALSAWFAERGSPLVTR